MVARSRSPLRKSKRSTRRKSVRFGKKENISHKIDGNTAPEGRILHYLTKLTRLFNSRSSVGALPNVSSKVSPKNNLPKSTDSLPTSNNAKPRSLPKPWELMEVDDPGDESDPQFKEKVYNIVIAALEYGLAHNLLEKKGNCFVLRSKRNPKIANRQPTPGPNVIKASYKSCNCNCSRCRMNPSKRSNSQLRYPEHDRNSRQCLNEHSHSPDGRCMKEAQSFHPMPKKLTHRRPSPRRSSSTRMSSRSRDRVKKICNCPQCRGRETEEHLHSN